MLQIKHLVDHFVSERIISIKEKETTTVDSLLQIVEAQLKNGLNESFTKMLKIMEEYGDLGTESLAKSIKGELNLEISTVPNVSTVAVDFSTYDNVDLMFTALVSKLRNVLSEDKFAQVRRGCVTNNKTLRSTKYPDDFVKEVDATKTLDELFDVVTKSPYCNWMNVHLLEKMEVASLQYGADSLVKQYKEAVSAIKLRDIFDEIPEIEVPEYYYSKAKEKWHKDFDNVTVKDVIGNWNKLERIFDVENPSQLLDRVIKGCVKFHWLIPSELVCHARYSAFKNWYQLNGMLYLDICDHVIKDSQYDFSITSSVKGMYLIRTSFVWCVCACCVCVYVYKCKCTHVHAKGEHDVCVHTMPHMHACVCMYLCMYSVHECVTQCIHNAYAFVCVHISVHGM